ncbi:uncharacterized protein [Palaemon carinicauda]|uniref:uncharacterized protein n=1 Tax=Palaemon carinicauda TaxID=392227 RepID=UPI0035B67747
MKGFGFLLLVALFSMSQVTEGQDLSTAIPPFNVNSFIDTLLEKYSNDIPSSVKIGNIDSKYAYDCYLYIANGIRRNGDATFEVKDQTIYFNFGLSTGRITVQCRWYKRLLFVKLRGTVKAYTNGVGVYSRFSMNLSENPKAQLLEFKVTELQPIKTDVTGLWIANSIAEKYLNKKVNGARDKIVAELEQNTSKKLQAELDKLELPFSLDV